MARHLRALGGGVEPDARHAGQANPARRTTARSTPGQDRSRCQTIQDAEAIRARHDEPEPRCRRHRTGLGAAGDRCSRRCSPRSEMISIEGITARCAGRRTTRDRRSPASRRHVPELLESDSSSPPRHPDELMLSPLMPDRRVFAAPDRGTSGSAYREVSVRTGLFRASSARRSAVLDVVIVYGK